MLGASHGVDRASGRARAARQSARQRRRANADRRAEVARRRAQSALAIAGAPDARAVGVARFGSPAWPSSRSPSCSGAASCSQLRQADAYEDAPQSHQVKTGTPTMGGHRRSLRDRCLVFALHARPFLTATGLSGRWPAAAIGLIDDFLGDHATDESRPARAHQVLGDAR